MEICSHIFKGSWIKDIEVFPKLFLSYGNWRLSVCCVTVLVYGSCLMQSFSCFACYVCILCSCNIKKKCVRHEWQDETNFYYFFFIHLQTYLKGKLRKDQDFKQWATLFSRQYSFNIHLTVETHSSLCVDGLSVTTQNAVVASWVMRPQPSRQSSHNNSWYQWEICKKQLSDSQFTQ